MEELSKMILPALVIGLGATLQASVGYGYGLIAVPLLILINPEFVPAPFIFVSLILMLTVSLRNRSALKGKTFNWVFFGLVLGTPLGVFLLKYFKDINYSVVAALIIIFGLSLSLLKFRVSIKPVSQGVAGFMAAVMGTVCGVGGAPIALLYQNEKGREIRAALSLIFFVASSLSFIGVLFGGLFQLKELMLSLYLLPGIFVGHWLGPYLAKYTDQGRSRPIIITLSLVSAIVILFKSA
ncbi:MAG: hypothetical protein COA99_18030 [Moraxellaceae bacterium]|nr:MAG: hypothetical protein COA99_18030 [Moraxellaceae bacterium]